MADKMHAAWLNYDIQFLICKALEPRQLARLAQTCTALFDPATDEIWRTINSFSPFMACLPLDFRLRPLRANDIQRLELYAAKVRNLLLECSSSSGRLIHLPFQFPRYSWMTKKQSGQNLEKSWEELWEEIARLRPAAELFSTLRRIRINNAVEKLLVPLIGISGSNLTHIHIERIHIERIHIERIQSGNFKPVARKILELLQDTPKLEYLSLPRNLVDILPLKLIQQSPLKHLRIDHRRIANPAPLRYEILQKRTLQKVSLSLRREWYSTELNVGKKYLPALKSLWLDLTEFTLIECNNSCHTMAAHSWVCKSDERQRSTRCPTLFLKGLDNPELSLLAIRFPALATGKMFLDIVSAARSSSRLRNLVELALAGDRRYLHSHSPRGLPEPRIKPTELREALTMLLPMPQLKILRITLAPNFLDVLDLQLYKSIATGLPALEKLWLGQDEFFVPKRQFGAVNIYERTPLHHLAAFCSMLPNLVEVGVGIVDGLTMEKMPSSKWACPHVESLTIYSWAGSGTGLISQDLVYLGLKTYFPNTKRANRRFKEW